MSQLCKREDSVVLVIDIQERLLPAMVDADSLLERTGTLLQCAQLLDVPILATEQYPKGLGPTVQSVASHLEGTVEKTVFSAFSPLQEQLDALGRRTLVIVGMEAHVCVLQTAMDAMDAGYSTHIVSDAVASRSDANKALALARCRQSGSIITCVESVAFEWLETASAEPFRAVSRLLR